MNRRDFVSTAAMTVAAGAITTPQFSFGQDVKPELKGIVDAIQRQHEENVQRLQTWIRQPSIAAENRGMNEGCELLMKMLREAGFQQVAKVPSSGQPGVFATLDAGAPKTVGLYFMYDVKQADPSEWSSPPFDAALVEKPGFGKVIVGRGATNQKGPEATFLAALHAFQAAGQKLPVNLVLVAEGEEEIGSPHFPEIVQKPEVLAALRKCTGIFMPFAAQDPDGKVTIYLGAKGVIEAEVVSSGEKWGRGPQKDVHSSLKASVDSPAWHLVEALATMVTPDGNTPAIEGYMERVRPLSAVERKMIADAVAKTNEETLKRQLGVSHWVHDMTLEQALEAQAGNPTANIEGLVGGYTGPGGKTILPHKAVAKMDFRLVPNMTAKDSLEKIKAHLAKKGFGDVEVNMTGGYDPTSTPLNSQIIQAQLPVYQRFGVDAAILPRLAGSWPGYVFTGEPLKLPAGHFGLGHGSGAHAPNEYYVIESSNPKVQSFDGAVFSFVEYLYEVARTA